MTDTTDYREHVMATAWRIARRGAMQFGGARFDRRELLRMAASFPGVTTIGATLLLHPEALVPSEVLAKRYLYWLDQERRLLAAELFGGFKRNGWAHVYEPFTKLIPFAELAWQVHMSGDRPRCVRLKTRCWNASQ